MATARSKPQTLDSIAEEIAHLLNVARLFENARSADTVFEQIARCDDFVKAEKPLQPDETFSQMALSLSRELIHYASDLNALGNAQRLLAGGNLIGNNENALDVLAKLVLIHILNRGAQRFPKDAKWPEMKKRLERAKQMPRAA